jgi:Basic region leucine zipper
MEHPPVMDLREMDVLRFFFEMNQQQMDPVKLEQILLKHQIQSQQRQSQSFGYQHSPVFKPKETNASTPSVLASTIPEPKIVFQYVPSPKFPTPTSTPEPPDAELEACSETVRNYKVATRQPVTFEYKERCDFIKLKDEDRKKLLITPVSSVHESDSDQETGSNLPALKMSGKTKTWRGSSVYNNLPDIVMGEFDKMLRESHNTRIEVVDGLNREFPVNYEYNPKKSRIRTNYLDPQLADDRVKNNIASRRSRQRKKFLNHVLQYSVDFDTDENLLLSKQDQWLRQIILKLEEQIISKNSSQTEGIIKLRRQCGFE